MTARGLWKFLLCFCFTLSFNSAKLGQTVRWIPARFAKRSKTRLLHSSKTAIVRNLFLNGLRFTWQGTSCAPAWLTLPARFVIHGKRPAMRNAGVGEKFHHPNAPSPLFALQASLYKASWNSKLLAQGDTEGSGVQRDPTGYVVDQVISIVALACPPVAQLALKRLRKQIKCRLLAICASAF